MTIENYYTPRSLEEAVTALEGGDSTVLAGGTDLMPQTSDGKRQFGHALVNINRVPELKGISEEDGFVRIGALTTITEMMNHDLIKLKLPLLCQVGDKFASDQIRNIGTIGGNICNASPAGDTLVPLLVLDASVVLAKMGDGKLETRNVPINEFFLAPGKTVARPDELLVSVKIPVPPANHIASFYKFGARPALDISAISIGLAGQKLNGALQHVRVAFGAVAPTPVRASKTESALEGCVLNEQTIENIAKVAADEVHPITDVRATAWYRKEMIHNMMKRMLEDVD